MNLRALVAGTILAAVSTASFGIPISLGDFDGTEHLIDFGQPTETVPVANPYIVDGVSFQVSGTDFQGTYIADKSDLFDNVPGASLDGAYATGLALAQSSLVIDFSSLAVTQMGLLAVSIDGIATFRMQVYDFDNVLMETIEGTQAANAEAVFIGVQTTANIHHVDIVRNHSPTWQHSNFIDDVRFNAQSVPDAAQSVSLFGFALVSLAVMRRRLAA